MTLEEFNSKYKYQSDKEKFGFGEVWEIPKLQKDGFYYGDCESYCLFLKNNIEQFKDWDYYYCKLDGVGHCVLYKNGDVIDCNVQRVVSLERYCRMYGVSEITKYSWFTVVSKIAFAKGYLWIKSLVG